MKRSRFTETQIIAILKESDRGAQLRRSAGNAGFQMSPVKTGSSGKRVPGAVKSVENRHDII